MKKYDVVYLGSGHAAWHGAIALRHAGKSVAIIEKDRIAGTCTNYGCNAKILLENPFEVLEQASHYPNIINTENLEVNWENLMNYKHSVIDPMAGTMKAILEKQGVDIIEGAGKIVDAHTVSVNGENYEAENIVIATGQHSNELNIEGKEFTKNSRDFLSLESMPNSITFIGLGIISIEFASIAVKAGVETHMIHVDDQPLRGFYSAHVEKLMDKLKEEGVHFHMSENVVAVKENGTNYDVVTQSGLTIQSDYVLDATGRMPNVEGIGLEEVGIEYSKFGVKVDEYLRTNVPNIYASGDVIEKMIPKLTPTATFESNYIAAHILKMNEMPIQYPAIPSVLYSLPRLSNIGVGIEEAKNNDEYKVIDIPFGKRMVFEYKNETEAEMTIVLDSEKRLVGAAIYGDDAPDLINLLTVIVNQKLTARDLNQMIFAFPGSSSGVLDQLKLAMML
ncbi:dihydrolipoyl dehydrogenase family protein [Staphylococcus coagulans]|uniref:dihydrolipoyl dehydrogenase family protein n=1 Tax=Staphylococcus coagulans TaxID=74706 RepID=UPI0015F7B3E2|nr:NAD(P)/FAD-dependent oxidoreductase [Staphylococcus coagulans]MBA8762558.1 FAD-dependent oxidoreductase [Staphylococcus coagulans]